MTKLYLSSACYTLIYYHSLYRPYTQLSYRKIVLLLDGGYFDVNKLYVIYKKMHLLEGKFYMERNNTKIKFTR